MKGRTAPSDRSSPPSSSRRPLRERSSTPTRRACSVSKQALGEAARQLGGIGGRGHHRHRVQQQPHVAIVLGLVAGEDALQPIEAARVLDVRALLPDADGADAGPLGRAQRLVRAPDQLLGVHELGGLGHRHARAELQAQDAAVVAMLAEAARPRSPPPSGPPRASVSRRMTEKIAPPYRATWSWLRRPARSTVAISRRTRSPDRRSSRSLTQPKSSGPSSSRTAGRASP